MFLKELKHFVSPEICEQIIEEHKELLVPSKTGINQKFSGRDTGRTSFSARAIESDQLQAIKQAIVDLTSLPQENQERPSIIKYSKGGFYNNHYDYFDETDVDFYPSIATNGGQRIYTCLLYLNDNFTGGFTSFPKLNQKIVPETGKLVWWNNTTDLGQPLPESLHSGTAVKFGTKWIMTVWIRLGATDG